MPIDLKDLARRGAASRISELEQELAEIRNAFPEVVRQPQGKPRGRVARRAAASAEAPSDQVGAQADSSPSAHGGRKKRTMSAEARARISAAQKARWAKQKRAK